MINGKKVIGIIPARGGSKGIPKKNIKALNGKPLIAWTIDEAQKSIYIDKLIVSSDDDEIINLSRQFGAEVPFKRPLKLAQDDTPGIDPVLHALGYFPEYDYIVLLQPTSPLRSVQDIDNALELCVNGGFNFCVSVVESSASLYWMYRINEEGCLSSIFSSKEIPYQRQKAPITYELNGAVYVARIYSLSKTKSFLTEDTVPFVMPKERSVDIDSIDDFKYCEFLLNKN